MTNDSALQVSAAAFTFQELTPTAFLDRAAAVHPDHVAVVDGDRSYTYAEFQDRSMRLAGALVDLGLGGGARVALLATNSHVALEAHNGVPWAGAVLVPLNIRLQAQELAYVLDHAGAQLLIAGAEFADTAAAAAAGVEGLRVVIAGGRNVGTAGSKDEYEQLLAAATPTATAVTDERGLLSINYTSGTTGQPKGVMYHHRGAYLQSLAMAFHNTLTPQSVYLWTLPMFHCSGWCFTWGVTAAAARHLCLRKIDPPLIWRLLRTEGVTHFAAAPAVLSMLVNDPAAEDGPLEQRVKLMTGGAPPSPALLGRLAELNIDVTHLYGLTETYGPAMICEWHEDWDACSADEQAALKARQGVPNVIGEPARVLVEAGAAAGWTDVPADGAALGEIALRGNNVMLGYYRDAEATDEVDAEGWFRTGDIGVMHPDGYLELTDRQKDVIISGGENIASVEVERALETHPGVVEAAVVAMPDEKWGEIPVAFVTLRQGAEPSQEDLIAHVRSQLAGFKAPRRVIVSDLPKTSTGKLQKGELRQRLREDGAAGDSGPRDSSTTVTGR